MSLMIEDDSVLVKYNEIWKQILKILSINFIACLFIKKNK